MNSFQWGTETESWDTENAFDWAVKDLNGSLVNFILTTIEAVLYDDEVRCRQIKAIRKLILDRHNANLREIRVRIAE